MLKQALLAIVTTAALVAAETKPADGTPAAKDAAATPVVAAATPVVDATATPVVAATPAADKKEEETAKKK